jgi:pyruvate dehydrogenase E1 component
MGATAGRTTLNGEGLQHEDGHSLLVASTVPNVRTYDPAFAYETAVVVRDGIRRMYGPDPEDVFYYLTLYNETYEMPPMPEGTEEGIIRGLYRLREAPDVPAASVSGNGRGGNGRKPAQAPRVTLLGSGAILRQVLRAQELLAERGVAAEVWSAPSFQLLRNEAMEVEHWNRLHPTEAPRAPYVTEALRAAGEAGPIVAASDWIRAVPDQVSRWVPGQWLSLGTDGFGRSDTREALRRFFGIDAEHITVAALVALAQAGRVPVETVTTAISGFGIDPEAPFSLHFEPEPRRPVTA